MLKLVLFVLPLGLDTFAMAAALGVAGLPRRERLRASLVMSGFEMAMPVLGLLVGRGLGAAIGGVADYFAGGFLLILGAYLLVADEDDEAVTALSGRRGVALIVLGLSVSMDELAMGFTIGLLHLSIWLAVVLIGAQAFLVAQLGLRLGTSVGEIGREWAERAAALALIGLGILILVEKAT